MKKYDLIEADVKNIFFRYVFANILSMVGLSLYIFADTFFIANGIGSDGLVVLTLIMPAWNTMSGLSTLISVGGSTLYAISKGRKEEEQANKIFTVTIVLAFIIGILLMLGVFLFATPISQLLGAPDKFIPFTNTYIITAIGFAPVFLLNSAMVCFVRNDHNPNLVMIAMLAGCLSNIILDYIFIMPLQMGVFGGALATGISPVVSLMILSFHLIRKKNTFHWKWHRPQWNTIKNIATTGLTPFISEFSVGIVILIVNAVLLKIEGSNGIAAYSIISNVGFIALSIFNGIAQGVQPLISQNYGANKIKRVQQVLYLGCWTAGILGVIICFIVWIFPEPIVSMFILGENLLLENLSVSGIRIYILSFLLTGFNVLFISFFTSIAKAKPAFMISSSRGYIMISLLVLILPIWLGLKGVWIAFPINELLTLGIALYFLFQFLKTNDYEEI